MPHGQTWFNFLPFFKDVERAAQGFGETWIAHQSVPVGHVFGAVFVLLLLTFLGFLTYKKVADTEKALVPEDTFSAAVFIELVVQMVYGSMTEMMGKKAAKFFLPLIGTCALFILVSNSLGLVPGFSPPTDSLNTTLACASVIFFSTHIFGIREHGIAYFKHFLGPIIKWYALPLMLLMFVIETISHIVRPMSLSIRLMGNMFADHTLLTVILGLVVGGLGVVGVFIPVPVLVMVLGSLVVVVQTVVFCLLSTVYIALAIEHGEH
ncbi:MAG: F0F1 ATP synthase subunit A [Myxococcales bacterium]|nr:MAG: F0F1 ATP synthase subunit A [Myxococcales bacterium]